MNGLQERWAAVTRSQSPADEARAVGALKGYLKDAGIPYSAVVVDQDGKETPYVEFAGERAIRSVRITFHTRQGDFRAPEWSPRDTENFYALFLE